MVEIERKWLLTNRPPINLKIFTKDECYEIIQYYLKEKNNNTTERIRHIKKQNKNIIENVYIYTKKTYIAGQIGQQEKEYLITKEAFDSYKKSAISIIQKKRYQKNIDNITWCLDIFSNINIILLEAEIVVDEHDAKNKEKWLLKQPVNKIFLKHIIKEVTNIKEFSNKKLAKKL